MNQILARSIVEEVKKAYGYELSIPEVQSMTVTSTGDIYDLYSLEKGGKTITVKIYSSRTIYLVNSQI